MLTHCLFNLLLQKIFNGEKFGPITDESFVIVVQVHTRVEYLSLLIESFSRVQGIENSILIFSHDVFVPELNEAIQRIDFTRVMQIFYPHSIQLNPHTFPGDSPDDCQRDVPPAKYVISIFLFCITFCLSLLSVFHVLVHNINT